MLLFTGRAVGTKRRYGRESAPKDVNEVLADGLKTKMPVCTTKRSAFLGGNRRSTGDESETAT